MRSTVRILNLTIAILLGLALAQPSEARTRGLQAAPTIWLTCENGARYSMRPVAVSDEVRSQAVRQRQGIHVRLMPMGGGYRYAGRGVWFDGWRENVYLYLSKYRSVACTVG
jgi:hypothetical protein